MGKRTTEVICAICGRDLPLKDAHRDCAKGENRWRYYCAFCYLAKLSPDSTLAKPEQGQ